MKNSISSGVRYCPFTFVPEPFSRDLRDASVIPGGRVIGTAVFIPTGRGTSGETGRRSETEVDAGVVVDVSSGSKSAFASGLEFGFFLGPVSEDDDG